jgi:endoglucanase
MLSKLKTALAVLAAVTMIGAGVTAATQRTALASTSACTLGTWSGYCGTQTDAEATALSWDVYQQHAQAGNKVIGWRDEDGDRATDFAEVPFGGPGGKTALFVYSPGGVMTDLCISEPYSGAGLVLRWCNGSTYQQFTWTQIGPVATPTPTPSVTPTPSTSPTPAPSPTVTATLTAIALTSYGTWVNMASGDVIQGNGFDQQLTGVSQPSSLTEAQEWAFEG